VEFARDRGDREAPFEADTDVNHDADDHEDHRDDAVALEFVTNRAAHVVGTLLGHVVAFRLERRDDVIGDEVHLLRRFAALSVAFVRLQADRYVVGADVLHDLRVVEARGVERGANFGYLDGLLIGGLDEHTAGEIERVVESARNQRADRDDEQDHRDRDADRAQAQKVDVAIRIENFHGSLAV
jgi:hypothetical protein